MPDPHSSATATAPRLMSISEALEYLALLGIPRTNETMRQWIQRHGLGRKIAGRWVVDAARLERFVSAEGRAQTDSEDAHQAA